MNKKILLTLITWIAFWPLMAQKQDSTIYPVVIQFQSFCCGVPDDKPLQDFICKFKKKNKIRKINAWRIGPMGKEGEYWLAFSLEEMNSKQAGLFKKQVREVTAKLKDKGGAIVEENVNVIAGELPRGSSVEKTDL